MIEHHVNEQIGEKLQAMAESMSLEIQRVRDETKARVDELEQKLMLLNMGTDNSKSPVGQLSPKRKTTTSTNPDSKYYPWRR